MTDDLAEQARTLIDANRYMVLGTVDPDGRPRVSPVYFAPDGFSLVYWFSSPESHHSRNIAERPEISIVIFDSTAEIGAGQAVYLIASAEQVPDDELESCLDAANGRQFAGLRAFTADELRAPGDLRLYRARVSEHEVHVPGRHPVHGTGIDRRVAISL
ncbi:pyridoxamine 5'-phosphate oxidase [Herbihabitans rhizosphaerae]|uniref:Pyridoxamine 5'-phosphate oxidase n=1 Tax=Herbihabitans rhizosphaerae TaxID=1872711 RepID=A0A4Q7KF13_9PSEU|nr:pyridoxamine 5'-phosphate oxidase family protein [Herbihabitans rhizosphaerae]RZS29840.1 pyridoxamine 5'-phosphate oxidase [Herbihabitans rhizosphaerae]